MALLLLAAALAGACARVEGTPTAAPLPTPRAAAAPAISGTAGLPSLRGVVEGVAPSVVAIDTSVEGYDFFLRRVQERGAGSGVIVRPEGFIVTNDHVVSGASSLHVALWDGRVYEAKVAGRYPASDIAVLKIDAGEPLPALEFADSDEVRVGDWVLAIGNALGLEGGPTVTSGIVSARGRTVETERGATLSDLIQTDAAINEGNSGGPLVDLQGRLVGINTTILASAQGIGFSISANAVRRYADDLIAYGSVRRPLIGLGLETLRERTAEALGLSVGRGVLVTAIGDGPAARAGIRARDVIVEIAGKPVASKAEFLSDLWANRPGDAVDVVVVRGDERLRFTVTLAERKE